MLLTQPAQPAPFTTQRHLRSSESSGSINDRTPILPSATPHTTYAGPTAVAYRQSPTPMNNFANNAPPPLMYVRALYDYDADDRTSLSFHEGDIIQVITQLESGWWDGVINGVRGWFPSNYCAVISNPEDILKDGHHNDVDDDEEGGEDAYNDQYGAEGDRDVHRGNGAQTALDSIDNGDRTRADFWIPQATADGRLFYYNTMTGESSMELPLESPSSINESGPRDRMTVNVPDTTQSPTGMTAHGYRQDDGYDSEANSASELDGASIIMVSSRATMSRQTSFDSEGVSPAVSLESIKAALPSTRIRHGNFYNSNAKITPSTALPHAIASTTSFTSAPSAVAQTSTVPRSFFDDANAAPLTWNRLVDNMKTAVNQYRDAINNGDRSEYVRRAEDISDHLRLLLAAGSGTTDNHSGQPSIISTNKALYPHFRDMMSKFSKLVISSHIAAADWPTPESYQKCLQEADGVLHGVYSYVEVARQQRGEEIPRLLPGFVIGITAGGSWQNNGLGSRDPMMSQFMEEEDGAVKTSAVLDTGLMEKLEDLKRSLSASIRELERSLVVSDTTITPSQHEAIGSRVCSAAKLVLEKFKPWVASIESINLSPLGTSFQNPQIVDFGTHKQGVYDNMSDLLLGCQAVAGPLGDEWAEVRGESLESRIAYVRTCGRQLESNSSHVDFSLQLLGEQVQSTLQQELRAPPREDPRAQSQRGQVYDRQHQRSESRQYSGRSGSLAPTDPLDPTGNFRMGDNSKVKKFFGEEPLPVSAVARGHELDTIPDFLSLEFEQDLVYESKSQPQPPSQVRALKGGTLMALVEQLTRHDKLDSSFNGTFLLTYRSFTTARELFELLVKRFQIQPPEGLAQADFETWRERKQKPIRFRVVNILKSWFDTFWLEAPTDETMRLIQDVYTFAKDTVKTTETLGSAPLMIVLEKRLHGEDSASKRLVQTMNQQTPQPIMPKNMKKLKFLDIDVTEFARQLTIIESRLYGRIRPTECLNKTWQKKVGLGEPEPAPNVKMLILHSNQLTNWVAEMILTQQDVKKRVVVIKHFVSVADVSIMARMSSFITNNHRNAVA